MIGTIPDEPVRRFFDADVSTPVTEGDDEREGEEEEEEGEEETVGVRNPVPKVRTLFRGSGRWREETNRRRAIDDSFH